MVVFVANDHTGPCRSIRLACEQLNIKVAYIQHAVSSIFPPLEFDYAFLDGKVAYDIYNRCFHESSKSERLMRNVSQCKFS